MSNGINQDCRHQVPNYNRPIRRDVYGRNRDQTLRSKRTVNTGCDCSCEEAAHMTGMCSCKERTRLTGDCEGTVRTKEDCGCLQNSEREAKDSYKTTCDCYLTDAEQHRDCPSVTSGCGAFEELYPVGMAYVPMQSFRKLFEENVGLEKGTIFSELDYPFQMTKCSRRCDCK